VEWCGCFVVAHRGSGGGPVLASSEVRVLLRGVLFLSLCICIIAQRQRVVKGFREIFLLFFFVNLHKDFLQQPFFVETTASPPVRGSLY
jgi:hypothetical protein